MQHDNRGIPLQRRSALALLGLVGIPFTGTAASAAEARLGRKVSQAVGPDEAARMVARRGPAVAGLTSAERADCCAADFREGRTLIVGGVLVAETEAVLWLLAAGNTPA